ncbi:MAG TPA: ABC transporter ATP-binding protein [Jiangellaceae bacterium]|nr:ABC transporter ATP-binding protein [Jiangellaceae bacterium]
MSRPQTASLRDLWPHVRSHRVVLAAAAVVSLVATGLALVQPLMLRRLVDTVGAGGAEGALGAAVLLLVAVTLAEAVGSALQSYLLQRTAEGVVLDARRSLVGHLLRLPIVEYDRRRLGDLISRVGTDTTLLRAVVTSGLFEVVSSVLMFAGAVVLMAMVDVVLLLITLLAVFVGAVGVIALGRAIRRTSERAQAKVGDMTAAVERALSAIRTLRASRATQRETERVGASAREAYLAGVQMAKLQSLVQPIMSICIQGAFIAVLGFGGYRVATGSMSLGDLMAFLLYLFVLVMPLASALQAFTTIQAGLAALDRMGEVLAIPTEANDEQALRPLVSSEIARDEEPLLEFDDVGFSYDEGVPVLRGVGFAVSRGTRTAIVGPSGAGKSTVLALVERFYEPCSGSIRMEGVDVRTLRREEMRARIAYVEQDAPVLAGSIADNLRLAAPNASDEELMSAIEQVGLSELVQGNPDGLATEVGDEGILVSGGQRQRLAWARALLAEPELLLLDEPTSSVDSRTEQVLQEALHDAAQGRTVLVVAHRLATVADSDHIIVVDDGRVQATGTHEQLLLSSELYRELASHQLLV